MTIRLEHANISVRDIDGMIRFLQTAFSSFRIRHDETGPEGSRWVHIGTDDAYIALNQATEDSSEIWAPYCGKPVVNHLGFEVEDAEAVRMRSKDAGYRESTYPNAHPHRQRVYFYDAEGNDWEFVQYFSDKATERNDYDLSDDG
jgi:catechol 2,3-dioxygenase-like lactoylglutathione lyase family enzyme